MPAPPVPDRVEEARAPEQRLQLGELLASADERARVGREAERPRGAEGGDRLLELGCEREELVATRLCPVVVAILRQELTAVERERSPVGGRSLDPARVGSRELEPVDVDIRCEGEDFVPQFDRLGVERTPRYVHGLVKVVRSRRWIAVSPEHVHRLFAMQPVAGREREQLHQLARLLQPPGRRRDADAVHFGCESTEEPEVDIAHLDDNLDAALLQGHSRLACPLGRARGYRT